MACSGVHVEVQIVVAVVDEVGEQLVQRRRMIALWRRVPVVERITHAVPRLRWRGRLEPARTDRRRGERHTLNEATRRRRSRGRSLLLSALRSWPERTLPYVTAVTESCQYDNADVPEPNGRASPDASGDRRQRGCAAKKRQIWAVAL